MSTRTVAKKKQVEKNTHRSSAWPHSLITHFHGVVFQGDLNFKPLFFKGAVKEITGYSERDFVKGNLRWDQVVYPEDRPKIYQAAQKIRTICNYKDEREYRIIRKDGAIRWVREFVQNVCDEKKEPVLVQGAFYGITRRKIAETRLSLQYAIAKALSEAKNHQTGVMRVLREIGTILGWEIGMLWKVDEEAGLLRCDKIWQAPTFSAPAFITSSLKETFARGLGLPGRVWVSRRPVWLTDVTKVRFYRRAKVAAKEGLHSAFAFPLCLGDEILGVVEFYSRSTHLSDRNLLKVLAAVGSQIGQFIERKRVEVERERLLIQVEKERYRAEQLAIESEKKASELDAVFVAMSDPLIVYDAWGVTVSANPAAVALYGFSPVGKDRPTLINKLSLRFLDGELVKAEEVPSTQALQGKAAASVYLSLIDAKGETRVVVAESSPVISGGKILGAVSTFHDVSDQVRLQKQKDSFIGTASHELKTPVTTLKAYSQILQNRFQQLHDEEALHYLGKMNLQLNKITDLVADLLDVTKIEAGKLALRWERFNLDKLITEVVEDVHHTSAGHQIIKKGEMAGEISADRDRLGQVFTNLLSNAIKYSPDGGKVIVRTQKDRYKITVSIKDFGVGILPADQKKVFDRFYRGCGTEGTRFSGLGLGLYISSEIIKQHGGKIGVKSKKGSGSTFFFDLPIKRGKKGKD